MKKMTTAQKNSWNKLTVKRTRKDRKRRGHVRVLKLAEKKINNIRKKVEKLIHLRSKHNLV